jgi:formamidopyrimidine-DNA glycosylase
MPELPEVETIRRDLERLLRGHSAIQLKVSDRRLLSIRDEKRWLRAVLNQPWVKFERKGKYLCIELKNKWRIIFHLRMTGQLLVYKGDNGSPTEALGDDGKGVRLQIEFESRYRLTLRDQRRFAEARLLRPGEPWRAGNPLGPDALTELNSHDFVRMVKSRTTRIQPLLMDQHCLAGVGNIYAQEALFKAAIRPTRPGNRVTQLEAARLFDTLQETLQTAISHRGSSSRNYLDANGESGSAQTLHAVYRKGGQPCPRCRGLLRSTRVGGRGSVFCPQCQK